MGEEDGSWEWTLKVSKGIRKFRGPDPATAMIAAAVIIYKSRAKIGPKFPFRVHHSVLKMEEFWFQNSWIP